MHRRVFIIAALIIQTVSAFTFPADPKGFLKKNPKFKQQSRLQETANGESKIADPKELIACRIQVQGAVQGGYFRACVKNEARRFRNLIGTMSPPSDDPEAIAEIYVEGKRKQVEGFVRWCKKGDVGLNQLSKVLDVSYDEVPTGIYDDFYVETKWGMSYRMLVTYMNKA